MTYWENIASKAEIQEMSFHSWSLALPKRQDIRSSERNVVGVPSPCITPGAWLLPHAAPEKPLWQSGDNF